MRETVKYKDATVVYSQTGSGQTVVLLHGFLEERSMWDDYAKRLCATHNVICIDLLGQGESDCLGYVHSMGLHAEAVKAVLDTEGVNSCAVVGHSMGGYVALSLAEKHPQLVEKLVLFHSTANNDSDERRAERERVISLAQRNKSVYVRSVIPTLFAEGSRAQLTKEIQHVSDIATGFPTQGIIANIRGMMERKNQFKTLTEAAFQTLIIHGELDPVIPTADLKVQETLSPKIEIQVVPEIGHMGHLEAPDACYEILSKFVGS